MTLDINYKKTKLYLCPQRACGLVFGDILISSSAHPLNPFNVLRERNFLSLFISSLVSMKKKIPYHLVYTKAEKFKKYNIIYKKDVDRIFLATYTIYT